LARAVDADDFRERLRTLLMAEDLEAEAASLKALADEPNAAELPALTAVLLAGALRGAGERIAAIGLLRRAVARHPEDVWVNLVLAGSLDQLTPAPREEAVRYYTAARALRPETAHELAHLLDAMGRGAEAEATFRDLVARRPDARNLACFGGCLKNHGQDAEASQILDRAIVASHAALRLKPDDVTVHFTLGHALSDQGKPAEAEAALRAALKLQPDLAEAHNNLGYALQDRLPVAAVDAQMLPLTAPGTGQPVGVQEFDEPVVARVLVQVVFQGEIHGWDLRATGCISLEANTLGCSRQDAEHGLGPMSRPVFLASPVVLSEPCHEDIPSMYTNDH
jgi:tetratricopeptide (TPR) repeat protein